MNRTTTALPTDRHVTYQTQYRRCGKPGCHCKTGKGHGPYQYAYWHDAQGKMHSKYIGKATDDEATDAQWLVAAQRLRQGGRKA